MPLNIIVNLRKVTYSYQHIYCVSRRLNNQIIYFDLYAFKCNSLNECMVGAWFHQGLSYNRCLSTGSNQSEKIMLVIFSLYRVIMHRVRIDNLHVRLIFDLDKKK